MARPISVQDCIESIISQAAAVRRLAAKFIEREDSDDDSSFDVLFRIDDDLSDLYEYLSDEVGD